jgi:hypothetical protein
MGRLPKRKRAAATTAGNMAKLYVADTVDNPRVPFLRGVLTGSLSDALLKPASLPLTFVANRKR